MTYTLANQHIWLHPGDGGWHFVTLPQDVSEEIRSVYADKQRSFGSIRIQATIGSTAWSTSLFYDTKRKAFLLPIKAGVRKAENLLPETTCSITITI